MTETIPFGELGNAEWTNQNIMANNNYYRGGGDEPDPSMATDPYFTDHHHRANYTHPPRSNPDDVHDNGMHRLDDSAALYAASHPEEPHSDVGGYPPQEGPTTTHDAYQYSTAPVSNPNLNNESVVPIHDGSTAPVSNPNLNNESVVGGGDSSTVPDIMVLNVLCVQVTAPKMSTTKNRSPKLKNPGKRSVNGCLPTMLKRSERLPNNGENRA